MTLNHSLTVSSYKCFSNEGQGFDKICPINLIIGKNNSGKSSLIDLVEHFIEPTKDILNSKSSKARCKVSIEITKVFLEKVIEDYEKATNSQKGVWANLIIEHFKPIMGTIIDFEIKPETFMSDQIHTTKFGQYRDSVIEVCRFLNSKKSFRRINAERDIRPEYQDISLTVKASGEGTTSLIRQLLFHTKFDTNLVRQLLPTELNKILNPDIHISDIHLKEVTESKPGSSVAYEIYIATSNQDDYIPLSKMGSGIKTILLVVINLVIIPKINYINKNELFVGLEELENNLHPALQRRLFNYIADYSIENKTTFFITTHSSIVIDMFTANSNAQLLYVEHLGDKSVVNNIATSIAGKNILKTLGYKASDLLLSNGIIWVEGPSDALYLELFLDLLRKIKTNYSNFSSLSYTIQSLSTSIWKYAGFSEFDWNEIKGDLQNKIITLTKVNHNHILVLDNDGNYDNKKPHEWENFIHGTGKNKAKLIYESLKFSDHSVDHLINNYGDSSEGKLLFWINEGTCETYLKYFIENKGKEEFEKYFEPSRKTKFFEKKRKGSNSSISKVELAMKIVTFSLENNLGLLDFAPKNSPLYQKLESLIVTIKSWN